MRGPEVSVLSQPGPLQAHPHEVAPTAPSHSLLRATWPQRCLAWQPAAPCGLRSYEPPAGGDAAQLGPECPSCPAPAQCPNAPGATSMVDRRVSSLPLHPTEVPLTPSPLQAQGLPERADERHAGTWTVTHTHQCQVRQPAGASSSARARIIAPVRGQGQRKGREAWFQETQSQEETKVQRQT